MAKASGETVVVDGRRLRVTNLDKVMYPATGTTKADVLAYYAQIAPALIPHARDRPLTRKRWVHGVGTEDAPGEVFFQKNIEEGMPDWIPRRMLKGSSSRNVHPLLQERAALAWFAQSAALELHVPQWRFGRGDERQNPDRLVLDLDPGPGIELVQCAEVARRARAILRDLGLDPLPVTSGSKGIHLYSKLDGTRTSDEISAFAHELARALEADDPDLVVSDMKKTLRVGRILVDWSQNNGAKTTIAPYSLRGRMQPTVAAPRTWDELDDPDLRHLGYEEVLERYAQDGDLLAGLDAADATAAERALEPTPERMATFDATPEARDRLATYRSMRDAAKTPEPVPSVPSPRRVGPPARPSDGRSFVIQEHHARRLHYDFRLEQDGVLVSWAVPKGVPTDLKVNHLAVHTEDHPLEYGTFEGTIPAGEYGGGEVTIWDAGVYDLEKWRDDEVIVTLHGRPDGPLGSPVRVALIRTGRTPDDAKNWLMHRMRLPGESGGSATRASAAAPVTPAAAPVTPAAAPAAGPAPVDVDELLRRGPMLASPGTAAAVGGGGEWAFEMKWDGIRALVAVDGAGGVRLISRNGNDLTAAYPELAAAADAVPAAHRPAVLDGEIVALRAGRPDFGMLQQRMNLTRADDIEAARQRVPVHLMVFDLLMDAGEDLTGRDYGERRAALDGAVAPVARVQVPPAFPEHSTVDEAMTASLELGLEGVVAKRRASAYAPGRRSSAWVKIKHTRTQEVVVGGWRPGKGGRGGGIGSLLLGIPDGDTLRYVGRVGTGFTDRALAEAARMLAPLESSESPFAEVPRPDAADAHWVQSRLVGEVEFPEWTGPGRLRQPSWRGWRPDKAPADVRREDG